MRAGNNTLSLQRPVDWEAGDSIILTSTSFDQYETETHTIAAVRDGGYTLELTRTLYYEHWGDGDVDPVTGEMLIDEMRAEVGLLSHNVVVQGDEVEYQWSDRVPGDHPDIDEIVKIATAGVTA